MDALLLEIETADGTVIQIEIPSDIIIACGDPQNPQCEAARAAFDRIVKARLDEIQTA